MGITAIDIVYCNEDLSTLWLSGEHAVSEEEAAAIFTQFYRDAMVELDEWIPFPGNIDLITGGWEGDDSIEFGSHFMQYDDGEEWYRLQKPTKPYKDFMAGKR
jgi:hypothetical protein